MTETDQQHPEPTLDQEAALRAASDRLSREFDGVATDEAVDGMLQAAHAHIADHANIDNFVPLLAERYTREVLQAEQKQQDDTEA